MICGVGQRGEIKNEIDKGSEEKKKKEKVQRRQTSGGILSMLDFTVVKRSMWTDRSRPFIRDVKTTRAEFPTKSHHASISGT